MNARRNAPYRPAIHLQPIANGYANTASNRGSGVAGCRSAASGIEESAGMGFGIDLQRKPGDTQ